VSDGYGDFCTIITREQGGSRSSAGYDAFRRKLREMDADAQREARKLRRQMRAEAIAFAAAAKKAGLPIDRVSAAGFVLALRDPEAAKNTGGSADEVEAWIAKQKAPVHAR
jgi:hypothetical protein